MKSREDGLPRRSGAAGRLSFDATFTSATTPDGLTVRFTRMETGVLIRLTCRAGQAVSRQDLLDAAGDTGSERNDRSIDFIVNRLRRKLGDDARNPVYIGTRYGEGYVWLPEVLVETDLSRAFAVVGPLRGIDLLGPTAEAGRRLASDLFAALKAGAGADRQVVWAPEWRYADPYDTAAPDLTIEFAFFHEGTACFGVVTARARRTGTVIHVSRHALDTKAVRLAELGGTAQAIGTEIIAREWEARAKQAATSLPVPLAPHKATNMPKAGYKAWPKIDERLRQARAVDPDNPELKMMYAAHLHLKYILLGPKLFFEGLDRCAEDEAEIERLVLDSLDFAQSQPNYAITAAKLLHFVDSGYRDLAIEMAERAHLTNTVSVSSLALLGQLRAFTDRMDEAIDCLVQAETLCPPETDLHGYVLTILCQALSAAGEYGRLAAVRRKLLRMAPAAAFFLAPYFANPESPGLQARAAAMMVSKRSAQARLQNAYYVSGRLFERADHARNVMRGQMALFQRRFGPTVVPDEVADQFPDLIF